MIIKVCEARQSATVGGNGDQAGGLPPRRKSDANLGRSMGGLVRYLVGPGKANEHTDPAVVAASEPLDLEFGDTDFAGPFASADTTALVAQLNRPMRDRRANNDLPANRGFVFHAVMALPPGQTADRDRWAAMARDYVRLMGFDDPTANGPAGKAPCRWVAVHHGRSTEGNDHIHIAVMMIRDDGTWASNGNSKRRSMAARKEITTNYGLVPAEEAAQQRDRVVYGPDDVHSRRTIRPDGTVTIDRRPAPAERVEKISRPAAGQDPVEPPPAPVRREPDNDKLRRVMTAAAGEADTEADYVKTLWRHGVLTRPRYAEGTTDVVTGYSVALRRDGAERSQWRAGGSVHKSLRLSALRSRWVDSPQAAAAAATTWWTFRGDDVPRPTARPNQPGAADAAAHELRQVNEQLHTLDRTDTTVWNQIGINVAAALAVASVRHEPDGRGPLSQAAEAVLRDVQRDPVMRAPSRTQPYTGLARSVRLLVQAGSRHDTLGWLAVIEQLGHTITAIAEARRAQQQANEATYLAQRTEHALTAAHTTLRAQAPSAASTTLNASASGLEIPAVAINSAERTPGHQGHSR